MMPLLDWTDLAPLLMFSPLLIAIAWSDLTRMIIPNRLALLGLLLFACSLPFLDVHETSARLAMGVGCFAICLVLFAFRIMGGGDTKILPVVLLFVPSAALPVYLLSLGASMALGLGSVLLIRRVFVRGTPTWVGLTRGEDFPMGVSFGLSGLILISVWFLGILAA